MSIRELVRPNIRKLEPYRCARDDFNEGILLDANENTHGTAVHDLSADELRLELNRYPDPHQIDLKKLICSFRGGALRPENIYLGVGSDEAIDSLIRVLCAPGKDKLLICPPTYGMYTVSADINDAKIVSVPLDAETFELRPDAVLAALNADPTIKLVYICSPGNPTARLVKPAHIMQVLDGWKGGVVVVDEAYIDFAGPDASLAPRVVEHERLAVLQTLSKSFGLAGLRLGICFASADLAAILNAMKAPYNISSTASAIASRALSSQSTAIMREHVGQIVAERTRLVNELKAIPGFGRMRGGLDANFLLIEVLGSDGKPSNERALHVYNTMAKDRKIVVRFRGKEPACNGCLRISIGTHAENTRLIGEFKTLLS